MATKPYTITMPEEIMGLVDEMARREHRSRSEMLREMVRVVAAQRLVQRGDTLGALAELLAPLRQATAGMADEQFDALLDDSIREVRDAKGGAGHKRAPAGRAASQRAKRPPVAPPR